MGNYISNSQGFMDSIGDALSRVFGSIGEGCTMLLTAVELPLELIGLVPAIIGAAISIVVFSMIVKFIIGR